VEVVLVAECKVRVYTRPYVKPARSRNTKPSVSIIFSGTLDNTIQSDSTAHISTMASSSYTPPGRLGDPNMSLETDPRTNPKVLKALQGLGMGVNQVSDLPDSSEWTIESLTPGLAASDAAFGGMYDFVPNDLPTDAEQIAIEISEQTVKGVDGNDIKLWIYKPKDVKGALPAVIYTHGGGMVSLPCGINVQVILSTIRIAY
jgi:hypothetical protein